MRTNEEQMKALLEPYRECAGIEDFLSLSPDKIDMLLDNDYSKIACFLVENNLIGFHELIALPNNRLRLLLGNRYKLEYFEELNQWGITLKMCIYQSTDERFEFWITHFEEMYLKLRSFEELYQFLSVIILKFGMPALLAIQAAPEILEVLTVIIQSEVQRIETLEQRGFDRPDLLQAATQIRIYPQLMPIFQVMTGQATSSMKIYSLWCLILSFVLDVPDTVSNERLRVVAHVSAWQTAQMHVFFKRFGGDDETATRLFMEGAPRRVEVLARLKLKAPKNDAAKQTLEFSSGV